MIDEKQGALRLLSGLENGGLSTADAAIVAEGLDPVLVYVIVSFLRSAYPASDPAANSVLERVVQLTSGSEAVVPQAHQGRTGPDFPMVRGRVRLQRLSRPRIRDDRPDRRQTRNLGFGRFR